MSNCFMPKQCGKVANVGSIVRWDYFSGELNFSQYFPVLEGLGDAVIPLLESLENVGNEQIGQGLCFVCGYFKCFPQSRYSMTIC